MSDLVKICSTCGHSNPEEKILCEECWTDIMNVESVEPKVAGTGSEPSTQGSNKSQKKICPSCGAVSESFLILCACGADLENVQPEVVEDSPSHSVHHEEGIGAVKNSEFQSPEMLTSVESNRRLFLIVGQHSYECHDGDVLGRQGTLADNLFAEIRTVSRRHLTLTNRHGNWFVTVNPGVQNKTLLDNRELSPGVPELLQGKHTVKMSSQCEVVLHVNS